MKKTVIDKYTKDRPDHKPLDPDQVGILTVWFRPDNYIIRTRGWSLNEIVAIMGWKHKDVTAIFRRPWRRDKGAYSMTHHHQGVFDLSKLNDQ